jgi:hypothetical protein
MMTDDARGELVMLVMRLLGVALTLVLIASSCKQEIVDPPDVATLRLSRGADGLVHLALDGADRAPRAVEVEITAEGESVVLEDAAAAPGLPIDTVRVEMRGTNRAILFAADKRGVRLPPSGEIATLRARAQSGGTPNARLAITRALVVDADATPMAVEVGAAVPLR